MVRTINETVLVKKVRSLPLSETDAAEVDRIVAAVRAMRVQRQAAAEGVIRCICCGGPAHETGMH